jgi:SusD/RagB-like outer membrane lipoprotein
MNKLINMKLIKITSIALLAGYIFTGTGCTRDINEFGDTNTNPGIVAEPITAALFTNTLSAMGDNAWSVTPGLYGQLYSETQYTDASRYTKNQIDFSGFYSGVLFDCQNIINYNKANPEKAASYGSNANQIAIARILKAWWYWRVTDAWGNVPYSKALQFNGIIPYDDQQAIYTDLLKELKEAIAQFDGGSAFQGDILLDGDISRWKKFANSLRVILGVRLAKADAITGKAVVLEALGNSAGLLTSYTEDIKLAYPGGNFLNPWYSYYNITQRRDYAVSETLTSFMNTNGDKRVLSYGSVSSTPGVVKGFPYGLTRTDAVNWANANTDWARVISNPLRTGTMPVPILTASQVWLARAEAAQLGWTSEVAATMYANGIEQGWRQWGVYNAVDLTAYMANTNVSLAGGSAMAKIFRQRWIAAYPDGQEAWNVYREANGNGNAYLPLNPAPNSGLQIPHRFAIAQAQFDLNPANTQAVATTYTANGETDSQYARIWWDKQ